MEYALPVNPKLCPEEYLNGDAIKTTQVDPALVYERLDRSEASEAAIYLSFCADAALEVSTAEHHRNQLIYGFEVEAAQYITDELENEDDRAKATKKMHEFTLTLKDLSRTCISTFHEKKDRSIYTIERRISNREFLLLEKLREHTDTVRPNFLAADSGHSCDQLLSKLEADIFYRLDSLTSFAECEIDDLKILIEGSNKELDERIFEFVNKLKEFISMIQIARKSNEIRGINGSPKDNVYNVADDREPAKPKFPKQKKIIDDNDPRMHALVGKATDIEVFPCKIVLANIDHHRKKGKTDEEIYRLLVKHFHPDTSNHVHKREVMRLLNSSYDKSAKIFIV